LLMGPTDTVSVRRLCNDVQMFSNPSSGDLRKQHKEYGGSKIEAKSADKPFHGIVENVNADRAGSVESEARVPRGAIADDLQVSHTIILST